MPVLKEISRKVNVLAGVAKKVNSPFLVVIYTINVRIRLLTASYYGPLLGLPNWNFAGSISARLLSVDRAPAFHRFTQTITIQKYV